MTTAHEQWVRQERERLVQRMGEDRIAEWESVLAEHTLPSGNVEPIKVLIFMETAYRMGEGDEHRRLMGRPHAKPPRREERDDG